MRDTASNSAITASTLVGMQGRSVLVVGDVMLDRFVDGKVARLSPEAPVPVLDKAAETCMAGGGANVATNLAALGCKVQLISVTGEDAAGRTLASILGENLAIDFQQIVASGRPTTTKTRYRAEGQQMLRVDEEVTTPIDAALQDHLLSAAMDQLDSCDAIILSDYAKGCLPPSLIRKLVAAAKQAKRRIVIDPKLVDFDSYRGADILTPNLTELARAAHRPEDTTMPGDGLEHIADTASKLAQRHDIAAILATLSGRGMLLAGKDQRWSHAPAQAREVFDVSGAGDTVVATLVACLASGATAEQAMMLANTAAGVVVGKSGTAVVSPGEIIAATNPAPMPTSWPHWSESCKAWRAEGASIGFTNGCFDLLHPGHIYLLSKAAESSDRLIVGINSDASVRRLKGDGRPMQSAEMRASAIMQLPFVDGVAIFDEDTPFDLISTLQPDRIVKGGDYRAEDVVGGDIVAARGGEVVIIPTLGNHSSTALATDADT